MSDIIQLFATTDLHGEMDAFQDADQVRTLKETNPQAIWIDNGDYFCGNALTTFYNTTKSVTPLVDQANAFGYDVMIPGNHDLDHGLAFLQRQVAQLKMPYVCANLFSTDGEYLFEPFTLVERGERRVAIIGLITQALPQILPYETTKDFVCLNTKEALEKVLQLIPEDVDLTVLSYHGGFEADPTTGRPVQYNTGEDQGYQLSVQGENELNGLIAGHQHFSFHGEMNGMACIQPGSHGRQIGQIQFEKQESAWIFGTTLHEVKKTVPNPRPDFDTWMSEKIESESVRTFLKGSFALTEELLLYTLTGDTRRDLLKSFPIPYTFSRYECSHSEWKMLLKEQWVKEGLSLSDQTGAAIESSVVVYSNDRRMPYVRLNQNYIDNLFDAYHRWAERK